MKFNQRTSHNIEKNFLEELLIDRGIISNNIINKENFFNPTINNELDPELLDHMEEGYQLLKKHLTAGSTIYIPQDPDVDGICSAAIFWHYLENNCREKYPNFQLIYHIPDGKEHGLKTLMKDLEVEKKYDLIVCIDSSSNDYEEHKKLNEMGYDLLVIDHHLAPKYSEMAVVINNQLSNNYSNKALCGAAVCYKFLEYFEKQEQLSVNNISNYIDLVALSLIGDVMPITTLENRYLITYGLTHINNQFLKDLIEKQAFSLKIDEYPLTPTGIAFYIVPLINALIRVGSNIEKERLFQAFITPEAMVPSTKRGEKGSFETISTQSVRNCINAKARQTRERDKAAELLDIQIIENCLNDNKILILNADELNINNTLTGVCAMGVAAKYKKPVLLGRTTPDGKFMKGSIRNKDGSPIKSLKDFLMSSNLMEFVEGHNQAAGYSIPISNIPKLIKYANKELKNVNFNEGQYDVDFIINDNINVPNLIQELCAGEEFYGTGCPEPIIGIENIIINKGDFSIIGKNKDTLRFNYNGVTCIKFKCQDLIEELNSMDNKIIISFVGKGNINRWGEKETPQILIDDLEMTELNLNGF